MNQGRTKKNWKNPGKIPKPVTPPTVPQEGHNFEFSENDFFHLISYFGPKRQMFFDEIAFQKKNLRFESNV